MLELSKKTSVDRQRYLADLFERHRGRLRKIVDIRLDQRLAGRIDPSDILQDTFIDAAVRFDSYAEERTMPEFVWLRFLALQRLMILARRHLGTQARDPNREVSIFQPAHPDASSAILAQQLLGCQSSPSQAVAASTNVG